jgi:crotonobetainyl-CoA:carnitine CoA-transferase CaiB-like acyl-CoA transferase
LERAFAAYDVEALCEKLMRVGVPPARFTRCRRRSHNRTRNTGAWSSTTATIAVSGRPVRLSQSQAQRARKPPRFNEHADQILADAGCASDQAAELRRTGAVRDRPARS